MIRTRPGVAAFAQEAEAALGSSLQERTPRALISIKLR
jgi:hypothetical protein